MQTTLQSMLYAFCCHHAYLKSPRTPTHICYLADSSLANLGLGLAKLP
jgi:hypothetical protein